MPAELSPYLLGAAATVAPLARACPLPGAALLDPFRDDGALFARLSFAGNALAFSSVLAMPRWVHLDVCMTASAMIGFAAPQGAIDPALWSRLALAAGDPPIDGWRGPVPLTEYCALATAEPGTVVGFSLYSLAPGRGLGVRTKALALACHGAARQIGITQWSSPAVATHLAFGPLELLEPRAPAHSLPDQTFLYRVTIPPGRLDALLAGDRPAPPPVDDAVELPADARAAERAAELKRRWGRLAIVDRVVRADGATLLLAPYV
jgi:hypothetical protein